MTMACHGGEQGDQLGRQIDRVERRAARRLGLARREKALEMFFGQAELAQGDVQAFLVRRTAMAAVHLHGHQPPATPLRKSCARPPLSRPRIERRSARAIARRSSSSSHQLVDAGGDVADFVVARRDGQGTKVPLGQAADLRAHLGQRQADPPGDPSGQRHAQHKRQAPTASGGIAAWRRRLRNWRSG